MKDVDKILKSIDKLPPFPKVARKALTLLNDPDASADQLIAVIKHDPAITANILKICNSAYFGLYRKVQSVMDGLVLLGNNEFKKIIMASSVLPVYEKESKGYDLARGELWQHAMASALVSQIISKKLDQHDDMALHTTTLLHDLGKVVLSSFVWEKFEKITTLVEDEEYSFVEAEKAVIGLDHAEVGARISELWKFPDNMVQAIRFHHNPQGAPEDDSLTHIVYLANVITLFMGIGAGGSGLYMRGRESIMKKYGLKEKDLEVIMVDFYDEYNRSKDLLGIAGEEK